MEDIWLQVKELAALYGLNILAAIAIFLLGKLAATGVRRLLRKIRGTWTPPWWASSPASSTRCCWHSL